MPFSSIEEAAADLREGRLIIIVDDEDRENEGDLVCAAELVTPEVINFMATHARGLICMPLTEERCDELHLTMQVADNTSFLGTAFTVSIEARKGVTTGISASDRATTILTAVDPKTRPQDLARPGHVFPLRAKKGGVLVRPGQTEASVDLARIAGLSPAGVICEIMNDDGTMGRVPDLERFCAAHGLKMLTVAEMIRYRLRHERYIHRVAESPVHTKYGDFTMIAYESEVSGGESHLALVRGTVGENSGDTPTLVRVHSHCLAGDVFGATSCDCRELLERSLERIAHDGRGALIYLHNNSPGFELDRRELPARIVLHRETRARELHPDPLHEERHQRVLRQVGIGGQILADLNIRKIRLLSNTPTHVPALEGFDLEIVEQVPILDPAPLGPVAVPPRSR